VICSTSWRWPLHRQRSLAAENLLLRKQLAFYVERKTKPWRLNNAARIALALLAPWIN
jgi:hypothetical protein